MSHLPKSALAPSTYRPLPGVPDELVDENGNLRPVWSNFISHFNAQSPKDIENRFARGDAYLRDSGVFLRQYAEDQTSERPWPLSHVPVLIHQPEWQAIVEGLSQRADLLEAVTADLYGENKLVADGHLPPELIATNPEWLRPLVGVKPKSGHFLHFLAFEIGRGPNGQWWVLNDRTQAPSGAGYALENRVATARVYSDLYPHANIERLAGFFRTFRDYLLSLRKDPQHHVAILSPGSMNESYYEHAYIARYLGFLLVEGEDLIVHDGHVMVRTVSGLQPVDVLWRRLDSTFTDPLELDEHSQIGTPGLTGAARRGTVTMDNATGSGVLETRAMMAFLPHINRVLFGEALKIPNIATWWCGHEKERQHVLDNIDRMMIAPALSTRMPFDPDATTVLGGQLRNTAYKSIKEMFDTDAANLVGQESVTLSTSPAYIDGQLTPRPMSLRVFLARTSTGWTAMPGGFARIGRSPDTTAINMQRGGSVADVWVVSDNPVIPETMIPTANASVSRARLGALPSQAADDMYWMGRYIERAEGYIRLNRALHIRIADAESPDSPLVSHLAGYMRFIDVDPDRPVPTAITIALEGAVRTASQVRDRLSPDGWAAISELSQTARNNEGLLTTGDDTARHMGRLLRQLNSFTGLVHENMYRFAGWRFLSLGRSIERVLALASALANFIEPAAPLGALDLALEYGDSTISHRRRYSFLATHNSVVDLMGLDHLNPRSILFHLNEIRDHAKALPNDDHTLNTMSDFYRAVLQLHTSFAVQTPQTINPTRLLEFRDEMANLSNQLTLAYMT